MLGYRTMMARYGQCTARTVTTSHSYENDYIASTVRPPLHAACFQQYCRSRIALYFNNLGYNNCRGGHTLQQNYQRIAHNIAPCVRTFIGVALHVYTYFNYVSSPRSVKGATLKDHGGFYLQPYSS